MQIKNPNFIPVIDPNAASVKYKDAVLNALRQQPEKENFTPAEIRGAVEATKTQLPDGAIAQICQDAGITVDMTA